VWADFGDGLTDTGKAVEAKAGQRIVASCSAKTQICTLVR
jgi:hypothetical protein